MGPDSSELANSFDAAQRARQGAAEGLRNASVSSPADPSAVDVVLTWPADKKCAVRGSRRATDAGAPSTARPADSSPSDRPPTAHATEAGLDDALLGAIADQLSALRAQQQQLRKLLDDAGS